MGFGSIMHKPGVHDFFNSPRISKLIIIDLQLISYQSNRAVCLYYQPDPGSGCLPPVSI
jgi:hypothetical protein